MGLIKTILERHRKKVQERNNARAELLLRVDEAPHLVSKRKPAGIPFPEEARKIAQGALDRLREEDQGT